MDENTTQGVTKEFGIGEAASFFDQSTGWLRWRERQGVLTDKNGEPLQARRNINAKLGGGDRRYSLDDVREIAHSLRRNDVIDDDDLRVVCAELLLSSSH